MGHTLKKMYDQNQRLVRLFATYCTMKHNTLARWWHSLYLRESRSPRGVRGCVSQSYGSGPSLEERGGVGVQVCDVFLGGPHTALTMRCLLLLLSDGG